MARKPGSLEAYKLSPENEDIVLKNLPLVRKVINDKFSVYHEWYEDMLQEGTIGLIRAVAKHRKDGTAQFSTYAYFCIKNEIQKFVSECTDTIRVPVSVGLAINGIRLIEERNGTEEEKELVLKHNQISTDMLEAGRTALATVSMDDVNEEGLYYRDVLSINGLEIQDLIDITTEEKIMYSNLHRWLNFNYPDELFDNRIYIDYIRMVEQGDLKISEIYKQLMNLYNIKRAYVRSIVPVYQERLRTYFSKNIKN